MLLESCRNTQVMECQLQSLNTEPKPVSIIGAVKIKAIFLAFLPCILLAPLISYYLAISKGEENPFPHPTITDTACHYPQDIQFRLIMGGSGSYLTLCYFLIFKWIEKQKVRIQYPGPTYGYIYYICQLSVIGFMIAMGTIDGGWYPDLHTNSAIFFFVMLFIIVMTQTVVLMDMHSWDPTVLSHESYIMKIVLALYVGIVWVGTGISLLLFKQDENDDQNIFVVILEWNSVYVCNFWLFTFLKDWDNLYLTLSIEKQQ